MGGQLFGRTSAGRHDSWQRRHGRLAEVGKLRF
jgi:hypothetical protein